MSIEEPIKQENNHDNCNLDGNGLWLCAFKKLCNHNLGFLRNSG